MYNEIELLKVYIWGYGGLGPSLVACPVCTGYAPWPKLAVGAAAKKEFKAVHTKLCVFGQGSGSGACKINAHSSRRPVMNAVQQ